MLKKCTMFSVLLMLSFIFLIIFKCKNIILITLIQSIIFSLLLYPFFCSLFQNETLNYPNKKYLHCVAYGFFLFYIATFSGIILLAPFVIIYKITPYKLKILTSILGGISSTLWLFSLTRLAFVPLLCSKKLKTCLITSNRLSKNNRIELFKLALTAYVSLFSLFTLPWSIKKIIKKIKCISTHQIRTKKYINKDNKNHHNKHDLNSTS